jgi:hypothetical protein
MGAVPPADDGLAGGLTTLRLRTYRSDADTDTDPVAQARLADLGEVFHRMSAWGSLLGRRGRQGRDSSGQSSRCFACCPGLAA